MINSKFFDTDGDGIGELHLNNDGYVDGTHTTPAQMEYGTRKD